ncbi:hypothetical protein [Methylobacterium bullatum]|uniref:Uncharacterized protein n=1 Tax=Methylobacterium bullatum TaxID=570505 RepID=A0AAV4Z1A3_9HYPH|nr:hypothetical protein [Methylobacterium bullatum]MBD8904704.1 hypothetical protein [Methylobacterium bullatum]GJD37766.1 hypothetical protein OICFNHDK_0204 [Methylobacterium bullatum]
MGLRLKSYGTAGSNGFSILLLRFREVPLHWAFVGEVPAGSEEMASCPPEDEGACRFGASKGLLDIPPEDSAGLLSWPPIRVALTGTVRGQDGKVRAATDADDRVYRIDEAVGAYR